MWLFDGVLEEIAKELLKEIKSNIKDLDITTDWNEIEENGKKGLLITIKMMRR